MSKSRTAGKSAKSRDRSVAHRVRQAVLAGSDRVYTHADFEELPRAAVSLALSRLAKAGELTKIARGTYYRSRTTVVGPTRPTHDDIAQAVLDDARPTGITAAALLGFTTQQPAVQHYAVSKRDPATRLTGIRLTLVRPKHDLNPTDGALLEFIRDRARWTELSDADTIDRLVKMLKNRDRFDTLATAALTEPPRVRAILGALGDSAGARKATLHTLRSSLNSTSRFDFGRLRSLPTAKDWQAK